MENFKKLLTLVTFIILAFFTACQYDNLEHVPVVDFAYNPTEPKMLEEVVFTPKTKYTDLFIWDFGDGSDKSYEHSTRHIYKQPGTFSVRLIGINDKNEIRKEITKEVVISKLPSGSIIEHKEDIIEDETWSSEYIHVISDRIELKHATLTIKPGTIVKFNDNASISIGGEFIHEPNATLIAQGTPDKHIVFTANKENPQQSSWQRIYFGKGASYKSIMEYCDISYGGGGTSLKGRGSIEIQETNIAFNHNTITHSETYGVYCSNDGFFSSFNHNVIKDNAGSAMIIKSKYVHTLGENNIIANTKYGIEIYGILDSYGEFTWRNHGAKYTVIGDVNVGSDAGTSLTIKKGVTIAFTSNGREFTIGSDKNKRAKLIAIGTETEPIRFESAYEYGYSDDWHIHFGAFNDQTSKIEYCEIVEGGCSSYYGALHLENTQISVNNCKITNSKSYGIDLWENASFSSFTGNTIRHSKESSIKISAQWAHTIGANNNIDNDKFGIEVSGNFNHQNKSFTWLKQTCPYTLVDDVKIGSIQGCTLTIEPGTKIQLTQNKNLIVGDESNSAGTLIAKGTPDNRITFSSVTSTNFWESIWFGKGTMSDNVLEYCTITNGGGDFHPFSGGAIYCKDINLNNTPTIKNCHIANSKNHGISIDNASPVLENNTFENISEEDIHGG